MKEQTKNRIKKIALRLIGAGVIAGFFVLFAAAIRVKDKQKCKGVKIEVFTNENTFSVEKSDIRRLILNDKQLNPVGQILGRIDIRQLEKTVETNPWVRDAQLYIDNNNELNIKVSPRQPLARVFTLTGNSFYIDTAGSRVPVTDKFSARVPVFTGFPTDATALKQADSAAYAQIIAISRFICRHPFWMAQVEQINITPGRDFEIIPKVGAQLIELGDGTAPEDKFNKLFIFYKDAIRKIGWETYDTINIAYANEVVCIKKGNKRSVKIVPPSTGDKTVLTKPVTVSKAAPPEKNKAAAAPARKTEIPPGKISRQPEQGTDKRPVKETVTPENKAQPAPKAIYGGPGQSVNTTKNKHKP
ncbi:MAG TPA: hypothetical protein VIU45_03525 [Chitinophagaceae bacterium]